MPSFRVRDLTINIVGSSIQGSEVAESACDNSTVACFNAASIHPPRVLQLIAAATCDNSTVACFNAASVHPPEIIRAAVPTSASPDELAALKGELRNALARLDELRCYGPNRDRLRALQPFVVNLYKQQLTTLENAGAIEVVADTVRAIRAPAYSHLYTERFGLLLEGPIQSDPTSLMA